jgi:hypothetical protein
LHAMLELKPLESCKNEVEKESSNTIQDTNRKQTKDLESSNDIESKSLLLDDCDDEEYRESS